jgi:hypothetical protein
VGLGFEHVDRATTTAAGGRWCCHAVNQSRTTN